MRKLFALLTLLAIPNFAFCLGIQDLSELYNSNQNGWFKLCSKSENANDFVLRITQDCSTTRQCPAGYSTKGGIHFGQSCNGGVKGCDFNSAIGCSQTGWVNFCVKDSRASDALLVNLLDNCSGTITNCPSGFEYSTMLKLEKGIADCDTAPRSIDYRGNPEGVISDGWVALCTKKTNNQPLVYFAKPSETCMQGYSEKGSIHIYNNGLTQYQVPTSIDFCDFSKLGAGTTYPYSNNYSSINLMDYFLVPEGKITKARAFQYWDFDNDGQAECTRDLGNPSAHIGMKVKNPDTGTAFYLTVHGAMTASGTFIHDDFDFWQIDNKIQRYLFSADPREDNGTWKISRINKGQAPYPEFARNDAPANYSITNSTYYERLKCSDGFKYAENPWSWNVRVNGIMPIFSYTDGYGGTITKQDAVDYSYQAIERQVMKENEGVNLFYVLPSSGPLIGANHKYYSIENATTQFMQERLNYLLSTNCFKWVRDPANNQPITRLELYSQLQAENCTNDVDDDSDTLIDCFDPDCPNGIVCGTGKKCNKNLECITTPTTNCPDAKRDGTINILDMVRMAKAINEQDKAFDITQDETTNIQDMQATALKIGTNC